MVSFSVTCYTSKMVWNWLEERDEDFKVLHRPPILPNLNPIELWNQLECLVCSHYGHITLHPVAERDAVCLNSIYQRQPSVNLSTHLLVV
ncbi:hypothetical protein TNIN_89961 [Trichonephila inaurata madagascariensis]|uniref:Uncharacterized protein n=1 Tax=Trichonephila inaurata madagascariensis TaxID=2747483 RepID=A0A8X6XK69_9ARAC|nr:hypothetical protein TNIN_89961 [Trichonephila inaurata madagascariensis]